MLARNTYETTYIDSCKASIDAQIAAYDDLPGDDKQDAFAPLFFNNMILALDARFMHRARAVEGKDGNPINEVRVLCTSIMENGLLLADKQIKLKPETSVLGLDVGDEIRLDAADYKRLSDGFFAEITKRFS
jgi:hypothetical protein